ncbi:MAG: ABC transporter permease, partial [Longimicrobiales bacterium]
MIRRLAEGILTWTLPRGVVGESIRADLDEELEELQAEGSGEPGRWWYLWESVKLAAYFGLFALRESRIRRRPGGGGSHRGGGFMESIAKDLRFAFRNLARRWVFGAVAVLTLGLGIGSATAMFSVVDGVLLQSVPFQDPARLVNVWLTTEGARGAPGLVGRTWDRLPFSLEEYRTWRAQATAFDAVAVHNAVETTLTGEGPAVRITLGVGSASLPEVLGVQPLMGRWFLPDEEGDGTTSAADVTVVSYETWVGRLGADPDILGKTLKLSGTPHTVIGVLPSGFRLRHLGMHWLGEDTRGFREVWVPIGGAAPGNGNNLEAVARLAPGVDIQAAATETLRILNETGYDEVVRIVPRSEDETHALASPLVILLAATGILLLIGCANVATLALGEMKSRGPELSTRSALGAGRVRIVRQLLTESLVVGLGGSVLGVALAFGGTRALVALAPPLPRVETVGVDLRVLVFAILLGVAASILFGTVPAVLSTSGFNPGMPAATRTASMRRSRLERWMVCAEIALTVV